jgi:hypothetical protein
MGFIEDQCLSVIYFFCAEFLLLFCKKEIEENLEKRVLECKIPFFNKKLQPL